MNPHIEQARSAASLDEALVFAGQAVVDALSEAMKAAGYTKGPDAGQALQKVGLDRLLARSLGEGQVDHRAARTEIDRLMKALSARTTTANDIKAGILAFDEAAQRIALSIGRGTAFKYPLATNRARDSLLTFARSLHR